MEETIGLSALLNVFGDKSKVAEAYSPLVFAYIGDCIFDLIIKQRVVADGNRSVQKLHEKVSCYVNAAAQSKMMRSLQDLLTDEERAIYKRGRNSKSVSPAKNQSITDYRRATGFEALVGYLYMCGDYDRLQQLIGVALRKMEETDGK